MDIQERLTRIREVLDKLRSQEALSTEGSASLDMAMQDLDFLSSSLDGMFQTRKKEAVHEDSSPEMVSILIVDDDPSITTSLSDGLSSEFMTHTASNGAEGLEMARKILPDIIITDISMPEMDGLEMCQNIKATGMTSHIPVILLTAKQDRQTIIHGLEAGASDYIVKPYDLAILRARMKNILTERQKMRDSILSVGMAEQPAVNYTNRLDKEFMDKVTKVMEEELSNCDFQIGDFCRKLAMSRTAFYSKLKALTGVGPNELVRMMRLNRAKELLESRKYNVTEVAEMVGFSDPKYFSICFKKRFDTSPSKI